MKIRPWTRKPSSPTLPDVKEELKRTPAKEIPAAGKASDERLHIEILADGTLIAQTGVKLL